MVLWELTLATAYFLGLKRTYRLALRMQRRVAGPKYQKTRLFLQRRTRTIFDVALRVHKNIQERDIEVGRNLGNRLLRWLDKMKPSAQIRGPYEVSSTATNSNGVKYNSTSKRPGTSINHQKHPRSTNSDSYRHLFTTSRNHWYESFPRIVSAMRSSRLSGAFSQHRHLASGPQSLTQSNYMSHGFLLRDGLLRRDIMQYLLRA